MRAARDGWPGESALTRDVEIEPAVLSLSKFGLLQVVRSRQVAHCGETSTVVVWLNQ